MKKVCMILPGFMKYPNKSGCAVETLVTIMGEKNDELKKVDLEILSKNETIKLNKMDEFLFVLYRMLKKLKINCFYLDRYYYKVLKKVLKENYDYVIFEGGDPKKYEMLCQRMSQKIGKEKMIFHLHQGIEAGDKKTIETFGKFIGISNFIINDLQKKKPTEDKNVKVLRNCAIETQIKSVSWEEKNSLRKKLNISKDDFVVLFVGRLVEEKGIYELIEAMKMISQKNIKLLILGSTFAENSEETEFSKKLKSSIQNFEERIIFTGYIPHDAIYQYYQIANIQVIPSIWEEPGSLTAIEAMASGLPIIATKSGGMVEYLNEQCAKMIEKDNKIIENLRDAILELYQEKEKCEKMGKSGIERSKNFTTQRYYNDFVKIMEEWEN